MVKTEELEAPGQEHRTGRSLFDTADNNRAPPRDSGDRRYEAALLLHHNEHSAVSETRQPSFDSPPDATDLAPGFIGCVSPQDGELAANSKAQSSAQYEPAKRGQRDKQTRARTETALQDQPKESHTTSIAARYEHPAGSNAHSPGRGAETPGDVLQADAAVGGSEAALLSFSDNAVSYPLDSGLREHQMAPHFPGSRATAESNPEAVTESGQQYETFDRQWLFSTEDRSSQLVQQFHLYKNKTDDEMMLDNAQVLNTSLRVHRAKLFRQTRRPQRKTQGPESQCFDYESIVALLGLLRTSQHQPKPQGARRARK